MPTANYKSNNAYEPDYERYNRVYTRSQSAYRAPSAGAGYTRPRPRTVQPSARTAAPTYAPRRTGSAPAVRREAVRQKPSSRVSAAQKRAAYACDYLDDGHDYVRSFHAMLVRARIFAVRHRAQHRHRECGSGAGRCRYKQKREHIRAVLRRREQCELRHDAERAVDDRERADVRVF